MTDPPQPPSSEPVIRTIAMPADTNPNGDIFGGWLMAQMDLAGGSAALRRARGRVATVAVDSMSFHHPVHVGDEVSIYARIDNVGRTSLRIFIEAWRRGRDGALDKVTSATFVMVAIGPDGRPAPGGSAMTEPDWVAWAREVQAVAQSGLTFAENPYDRERYEALRLLSARIMAEAGHADLSTVTSLFAAQEGYATPKVDVRGAVFDAQHRMLLVREVQDGGRWTLPGGWADVNLTPAENVAKEVREESGFSVRVSKLAAVWDRTRQGHGAAPFSACKFFFICDLVGGAAATSLETSEVAWFAESALPTDLSMGRVLPHQLLRMFEHRRRMELATDYE